MGAVSQGIYDSMCSLLINNCEENVSLDKIQVIKMLYEDKIKSNRRLENIINLKDLIRVLEKRDCLSCMNVEILYEIADNLNAKHLLNYCNNSRNEKLMTRIEDDLQNLKIKSTKNPELTNEEIRKQKIHKVVSEKLGKSWIDFARALDVPECKIDELKIQYPSSLRMCAVNILDYHEMEAHPRVWLSELQEALQKARRNDIYSLVQKIIVTYV